jgi:hypothetical protein
MRSSSARSGSTVREEAKSNGGRRPDRPVRSSTRPCSTRISSAPLSLEEQGELAICLGVAQCGCPRPRNDDQVHAVAQAPPLRPEPFADQPLYPVSDHRTTDTPAHGDSQPCPRPRRCAGPWNYENDKARRREALALAAGSPVVPGVAEPVSSTERTAPRGHRLLRRNGYGQPPAAFCTPALDDSPARGRPHPGSEAMSALAANPTRLVRALHLGGTPSGTAEPVTAAIAAPAATPNAPGRATCPRRCRAKERTDATHRVKQRHRQEMPRPERQAPTKQATPGSRPPWYHPHHVHRRRIMPASGSLPTSRKTPQARPSIMLLSVPGATTTTSTR